MTKLIATTQAQILGAISPLGKASVPVLLNPPAAAVTALAKSTGVDVSVLVDSSGLPLLAWPMGQIGHGDFATVPELAKYATNVYNHVRQNAASGNWYN
jgi:hypothetical protein